MQNQRGEFMTNEELVMVIKGGNDELTPSLWERVERFAHVKATDYYYLHTDLCARAGVTLDDLKQESYFAFMAAVNYYDPDKHPFPQTDSLTGFWYPVYLIMRRTKWSKKIQSS